LDYRGLKPYIPKIGLGHCLDSSGHSFRHVYKENLHPGEEKYIFYLMNLVITSATGNGN
jgi:hypothetical protein